MKKSRMPPSERGGFGKRPSHSYEALSRYYRYRPIRKECALLVIDMQDFFLDGSSHACISNPSAVEGNVRSVLNSFREAEIPVFFTKHVHHEREDLGAMGRWWRDPLMASSPMSELRIEPIEGEKIIHKSSYDAFYGTDLERWLRGMGVEEIVLIGVMTHLCVETTARSAFVRDLDVTVVGDATGSSSEKLHINSLTAMAHGLAVIKNTIDVIREVSP